MCVFCVFCDDKIVAAKLVKYLTSSFTLHVRHVSPSPSGKLGLQLIVSK